MAIAMILKSISVAATPFLVRSRNSLGRKHESQGDGCCVHCWRVLGCTWLGAQPAYWEVSPRSSSLPVAQEAAHPSNSVPSPSAGLAQCSRLPF